jgi:A/G-specific adenine glycosylase
MSLPESPLTLGEKRRLTRLAKDLLSWQQKGGGRYFPWRTPATPLFQLICVEVLLQRTRAETVASFYKEFFTRFPDWKQLANANQYELEQFLRPLGLWKRRSASLRSLANYAVLHDGVFPEEYHELIKVPAVGQYVAYAIMLFQRGKRYPLIDVNMARVVERYVRPRKLRDIRYDPWLQAACKWLVRSGDPRIVNWAVLDHAAITCRARNPLCQSCVLRHHCSMGYVK